MIFLTVGTQLNFDRLVRLVDEWNALNPSVEVFGQIGESSFTPRFSHRASLPVNEFHAQLCRTELVVSHAGMGSILTSLEARKPIIVVPRDHTLGEHRNRHQMSTASKLSHIAGVYVAWTKGELFSLMDQRSLLSTPGTDASNRRLVEFLRKQLFVG